MAIGTGPRDAVLIDAHAPNTEGRIGSDAADGDLLVLCVVVTIACQQAGHGGHIVGQIHTEGIAAQLLARHTADRRGDVEGGHPDAGGRHHDLIDRVLVGGLHGRGERQRQEDDGYILLKAH